MEETGVICYPIESKTPIQQDLEQVLLTRFKNGIRIDSKIELTKLRRLFYELNHYNLDLTDTEIINALSSTYIICNNRAYHPHHLVNVDQREQLIKRIVEKLKMPNSCAYYDVLFDEMHEMLLDTHISSQSLLKAYIEYEFNGQFLTTDKCIYNGKTPENIESALIQYLQTQTTSVSLLQIESSLPFASPNELNNIIASNHKILKNNDDRYFLIDTIDITEDELQHLLSYIRTYIELKGYITPKELYYALCTEFPTIHDRNNDIGYIGWRSYLYAKFNREFHFTGSTISKVGSQINSRQIYLSFVTQHPTYSMDDLISLRTDLGTRIDYSIIFEHSVRVSENKFVPKNEVEFDIDKIDSTICYLKTDRYLFLCDIKDYSIFPYCGYPWNGFILEQYVDIYSRKYKLIHRNYNKKRYTGIIVDTGSKVKFDDAIVEIVAYSNIELTDIAVIDYLTKHGLITKRRLDNIELILYKANNLRRRKGDE